MKVIHYIGLDVHAESISVAVADADSVRSLGKVPNSEDAVRKLAKKLGKPQGLRVVYEAGPTGYVLYWLLTSLGIECQVVAPTLIPVKAGDRVKTDRRDAEKLARLHRSGELTAVWVPDKATEALRDLVRAREAAKKDELRARHRLSKFLLRQGRRPTEKMKAWTSAHLAWVRSQTFEHRAQEAAFQDYLHEIDHVAERLKGLDGAIDAAVQELPPAQRALVDGLQALRGIRQLTAVTIATEVGELSRFSHPTQMMSYSGLVPSEHSSGNSTRRGAITKAGNDHLRRVVIEAAWAYHYRASMSYPLRKRQEGQSAEVREISWKAQQRLHKRYIGLLAKGKCHNKVLVAVGRELLGFIWAIGVQIEKEQYARRQNREAA